MSVKFRRDKDDYAPLPQADRGTFPEGLLAEARSKPNGWVYEIDARYDPDGAVPFEGIKGAWKVGADGLPTGEYWTNPNYMADI